MMESGRHSMAARRGDANLGFGARVYPHITITVADVKAHFEKRLEQIGNKRLKLGDVKSADGKITADIDTVDNSLVERFSVDPESGAISRIE